MADKKDFDDEYQFHEVDDFTNVHDDKTLTDEAPDEIAHEKSDRDLFNSVDIRKIAFMGIGALFAGLVVYKFIGAYITSKHEEATQPKVSVPQVVQAPGPVIPQELSVQPTSPNVDSGFSQKIATFELNQNMIQSNVNSIQNQMGGQSAQLNDLSNKLDQAMIQINQLTALVQEQSQQIQALKTKPRKPAVHRVQRVAPAMVYYIQAIIPGRAWLIASNGSTITVREGSSIPGYGVVKLIDPSNGKVMTSSGKTIVFSQADS